MLARVLSLANGKVFCFRKSSSFPPRFFIYLSFFHFDDPTFDPKNFSSKHSVRLSHFGMLVIFSQRSQITINFICAGEKKMMKNAFIEFDFVIKKNQLFNIFNSASKEALRWKENIQAWWNISNKHKLLCDTFS